MSRDFSCQQEFLKSGEKTEQGGSVYRCPEQGFLLEVSEEDSELQQTVALRMLSVCRRCPKMYEN